MDISNPTERMKRRNAPKNRKVDGNIQDKPKSKFPKQNKKSGKSSNGRNNINSSNENKDGESNIRNSTNELNTETKVKKSSHSKQRNRRHNNKKRDRDRKNEPQGFKLVLRLLPPNLTEEEFFKTFPGDFKQNMVNYGIMDHYYVQGHYSTKIFDDPTYSRGYFIFDTIEKLKQFGLNAQQLTFVDDKDNATKAHIKISPYVKKITPTANGRASKRAVEATIEDDDVYKLFLKSLKIKSESENSEYKFNDFSLLKSIDKEIASQTETEKAIKKKVEKALTELAGSIKIEKAKKSKSKSQKDKKKKKEKEKAKKKKSKSKKDSMSLAAKEKNENIVIIEAAGKKELQKRKKLQLQKEKDKEKSSANLPKLKIKKSNALKTTSKAMSTSPSN